MISLIIFCVYTPLIVSLPARVMEAMAKADILSFRIRHDALRVRLLFVWVARARKGDLDCFDPI